MFGLTRKEKFPSFDWHDNALRKTDKTPDVAFLESLEHQLVFVADEFMSVNPKASVLEKLKAKKEFECFSKETYTVYQKRLGRESFPIPLSVEHKTAPSLQVKGELYSMRSTALFELDKYKENGVQFQRIRVPVNIPVSRYKWFKDRKHAENEAGKPLGRSRLLVSSEQFTKQVWMYVGIEEYWPIDGGYLFERSPVYESKKFNRFYYFKTGDLEKDAEK